METAEQVLSQLEYCWVNFSREYFFTRTQKVKKPDINRYLEKYVAENKFKNEQEYRERYKAINEILLKYKEKVEEFREDIRVVELFIAKEYIKELKDKVYLREDIKENINRYLNGLKVYNKYLESVVQVKAIPEFEKRYLKYIYEFGQELNFESAVNEVS